MLIGRRLPEWSAAWQGTGLPPDWPLAGGGRSVAAAGLDAGEL